MSTQHLLPAFVGTPEVNRIYCMDALALLRALPTESVNCIITSPPYFGLRDYGVPGQIGLEPTPQAYVAALTELFREARRVLRADGTLWLNVGDSYNSSGTSSEKRTETSTIGLSKTLASQYSGSFKRVSNELPEKSLLGIPWRVAFALQDDGWILRSDIIWAKPNPMPESVTDRPTKSHEYVFLFAKSPRYFYDAAAIAEPAIYAHSDRRSGKGRHAYHGKWDGQSNGEQQAFVSINETRNKRDVWTVNSKPFSGSHFATFPPDLIEPMILAGCPSQVCCVCGAPWARKVEAVGGTIGKGWTDHKNDLEKGMTQVNYSGGVGNARDENGRPYQRIDRGFYPSCTCNAPTHPGLVLDPFMGAATTAIVAQRLGRNYIGSELNPEYVEMARQRIQRQTLPLPLFDTLPTQAVTP